MALQLAFSFPLRPIAANYGCLDFAHGPEESAIFALFAPIDPPLIHGPTSDKARRLEGQAMRVAELITACYCSHAWEVVWCSPFR